LRPKLTRRERLRLPQKLRFKKTPHQKRLMKKYPQRKFAVLNINVHVPEEVQKINLQSVLSGKKPGSKFYKITRMSKKALQQYRKQRQTTRAQKKLEKAKEKLEKPAETTQPATTTVTETQPQSQPQTQ